MEVALVHFDSCALHVLKIVLNFVIVTCQGSDVISHHSEADWVSLKQLLERVYVRWSQCLHLAC